MISKQYSLPSAIPEILKGDVLKLINKRWEVVFTAGGIPVVDKWKMPRDWRDDIDAARYLFRVK